jgi:hypothetical protein
MWIDQAKELIKRCARAQVRHGILMVGQMGIGKTQIVEQVVNELAVELGNFGTKSFDLTNPKDIETLRENFGFVDLRLATQEPADLVGYPFLLDKISKLFKKAYKVLSHAQPEWFPEEGTRGILFLDELNRAPTDVRQAIFQLVKERRLHTHNLPKGWFIVAAINPDNGQYQVETLDKAMFRRFCVIKVRTNEDIWLRWATKADINEKIRGFIAQHPNLLVNEEKIELELEHTPDQYTMLGDYMDSGVIPQEIFNEVAVGFLGNVAAVALEKWINEEYKRPVRGIDVLDRYDEVSHKLQGQKIPEWDATLTEMSAEMFANDSPTNDRIENIIKFMQKAPGEIIATFMSKLPSAYCKVLVSRREVTAITAKMVRSSKEI